MTKNFDGPKQKILRGLELEVSRYGSKVVFSVVWTVVSPEYL